MSNSWWEINIICDPRLEESIFWRLESFGCSGTAREIKEDSYLIKAYIPVIKATEESLTKLANHLQTDAKNLNLSSPQVKWQTIAEEDWGNSWKKHWQPTPIGDSLIVYPAWLSPPANSERTILRLDPGVAFGTGVHPTTQLCIESLEMRLKAQTLNHPVTIADIGCGSGILSIAALLLGADKAYAVDTDPLAVKAAQENSQLNDISPERLIINQGSVDWFTDEIIAAGLDGIVCNILAEVILEIIPWMSVVAKANTWGILSGITVEQAEKVYSALEEHGWIVATVWKRGQWCCFNIRQNENF
ncbi:MAG: 50S ribosomal protein L11 methyltransferase [Cyanobacteria bacterium J083]|nr:MAG: 50S ribosomal protein L11 methyltransferase [Cyanobacteria bacterium J083]